MCERKGKGVVIKLSGKKGYIQPDFDSDVTILFTMDVTPINNEKVFRSTFSPGTRIHFIANSLFPHGNLICWDASFVGIDKFAHGNQKPSRHSEPLQNIPVKRIPFQHTDPVISFLHDLLVDYGPLSPTQIGLHAKLLNISKDTNFSTKNKLILEYVKDYAQYFQVRENLIYWEHRNIIPCPWSSERAKSSPAAFRFIKVTLQKFHALSLSELNSFLCVHRVECPGSLAHMNRQTELLEEILMENEFDYDETDEYVFYDHVDPLICYLRQLFENNLTMKFSEIANRLREDNPNLGLIPFEVSNRKLNNFFQEYPQYFETINNHVVSWKFKDIIPPPIRIDRSNNFVAAHRYLANLMKETFEISLFDLAGLILQNRTCTPASLSHIRYRLDLLEMILQLKPDVFVVDNGICRLVSVDSLMDDVLSHVPSTTYSPAPGKLIFYHDADVSNILPLLPNCGLLILYKMMFYTAGVVRAIAFTQEQLLTALFLGKLLLRGATLSQTSIKSAPNVVKTEVQHHSNIREFLTKNGFFFSVNGDIIQCHANSEEELVTCIKKLLPYAVSPPHEYTPTSDLSLAGRTPELPSSGKRRRGGRGRRSKPTSSDPDHQNQMSSVEISALMHPAIPPLAPVVSSSNPYTTSISTKSTCITVSSNPVQPNNESHDDMLMAFAGAAISPPPTPPDPQRGRKGKKSQPPIPVTCKAFMPVSDVYVNPVCGESTATTGSDELETAKSTTLEERIFGKSIVDDSFAALKAVGLDPYTNLILIRFDVGKKPAIRYANYSKLPATHHTTTLENQPVVTDNQVAKILKHKEVCQAKPGLYGVNESLHCIRTVMGPSKVSGLTWLYNTHMQDIGSIRGFDTIKMNNITAVIIDSKQAPISKALSYIRNLCEKHSNSQTNAASEVVIVDWDGQITGYGEVPHPSIANCMRVCGENYASQKHALNDAVAHHPDYIVAANVKTQEALNVVRDISLEGVTMILTVPATLRDAVELLF